MIIRKKILKLKLHIKQIQNDYYCEVNIYQTSLCHKLKKNRWKYRFTDFEKNT